MAQALQVAFSSHVALEIKWDEGHFLTAPKPSMSSLTNDTNILHHQRFLPPYGGAPVGHEQLCCSDPKVTEVFTLLDWVAQAPEFQGCHVKFVFACNVRLARVGVQHSVTKPTSNRLRRVVGAIARVVPTPEAGVVQILINTGVASALAATLMVPGGFTCRVLPMARQAFIRSWNVIPPTFEVIIQHFPSKCCVCGNGHGQCRCIKDAVEAAASGAAPFQMCSVCMSASDLRPGRDPLLCNGCIAELVEWKAGIAKLYQKMSTLWKSICKPGCDSTCRLRSTPWVKTVEPQEAPLNVDFWALEL